MLISKILVPIDGSENSIRSLNHGLFLSSNLKLKITILFVIEVPPFVYIQSQKVVNSVMASLEKEAKDTLEEGRNQAKKYDVEPEILFLEGSNIASIIIEHAEKNNFDLIVMGSKGKGKLKTSLLGSVSNKVIHHSKTHIYIVK